MKREFTWIIQMLDLSEYIGSSSVGQFVFTPPPPQNPSNGPERPEAVSSSDSSKKRIS